MATDACFSEGARWSGYCYLLPRQAGRVDHWPYRLDTGPKRQPQDFAEAYKLCRSGQRRHTAQSKDRTISGDWWGPLRRHQRLILYVAPGLAW